MLRDWDDYVIAYYLLGGVHRRTDNFDGCYLVCVCRQRGPQKAARRLANVRQINMSTNNNHNGSSSTSNAAPRWGRGICLSFIDFPYPNPPYSQLFSSYLRWNGLVSRSCICFARFPTRLLGSTIDRYHADSSQNRPKLGRKERGGAPKVENEDKP